MLDPVLNSRPPSPLKKAIDEVAYLESLSNKNLTRIDRAKAKALGIAAEVEAAATVFLNAIDAFMRSSAMDTVPEPSLLALYTAMGREPPLKEVGDEASD